MRAVEWFIVIADSSVRSDIEIRSRGVVNVVHCHSTPTICRIRAADETSDFADHRSQACG